MIVAIRSQTIVDDGDDRTSLHLKTKGGTKSSTVFVGGLRDDESSGRPKRAAGVVAIGQGRDGDSDDEEHSPMANDDRVEIARSRDSNENRGQGARRYERPEGAGGERCTYL